MVQHRHDHHHLEKLHHLRPVTKSNCIPKIQVVKLNSHMRGIPELSRFRNKLAGGGLFEERPEGPMPPAMVSKCKFWPQN